MSCERLIYYEIFIREEMIEKSGFFARAQPSRFIQLSSCGLQIKLILSVNSKIVTFHYK